MSIRFCDDLFVSIDRAELLDRVGGDEELLREITGIFMDECPGLLLALHGALDRADAHGIERAAHSLKGSVSNFGAESVTDAAFRLEQIGRHGRIHEAKAALEKLEQQLELLRPALLEIAT